MDRLTDGQVDAQARILDNVKAGGRLALAEGGTTVIAIAERLLAEVRDSRAYPEAAAGGDDGSLSAWVREERARHDARKAGGLETGDVPTVVPSVLKELERRAARSSGGGGDRPAGNDVVCGDHWHGLSGEPVNGSTGCPWCHVASLQAEIAKLEGSGS